MTILFVAIGGAAGSVLRYVSVSAAARLLGQGFPYGTLAVNVIGSLAMGLAVHFLVERGPVPLAPAVMAGLLGGFTTFSAFSLEAVALFEAGRVGAAVIYITASVGLSLLALLAGLTLARAL